MRLAVNQLLKATLIFFLFLAGQPTMLGKEAEPAWKVVGSGKWINISVEDQLYKRPPTQPGGDYILHFRMENISSHTIGINNTWRFGVQDALATAKPTTEIQFDYKTGPRHMPEAEEKKKLINDFNQAGSRTISRIEPGGHKEYYAAYTPVTADFHDPKFILFLIDGISLVTDGKTVETVQRSDQNNQPTGGVVYDNPASWYPLSLAANSSHFTPDKAEIFPKYRARY